MPKPLGHAADRITIAGHLHRSAIRTPRAREVRRASLVFPASPAQDNYGTVTRGIVDGDELGGGEPPPLGGGELGGGLDGGGDCGGGD